MQVDARLTSLESGSGLGPGYEEEVERINNIPLELRADNHQLRGNNDSLSERVAELEAGGRENNPGRGVGALKNNTAKSVVESRAVSNLAELTDDKSKFRQWNVKLINTLTHLNRCYGWAIEIINECLDKGWGSGRGAPPGQDVGHTRYRER